MAKETHQIHLLSRVYKYLFFVFCIFSNSLYPTDKAAFYDLMGKKQDIWNFVLKEDLKTFEQFRVFFEKTINQEEIKSSIPKKIHFIWVGPKDFPKTSIKNIYSWIEKNPGFQVYFWSDRERPLPHPAMKLCLIDEFHWLFLKELFLDSNNYGEQSDLLRYEVLYQEGGIYVDHDVECFKPFIEFTNYFDLFCGLEPPHKPIGGTSVTVCNNLIGSCPKHPILKNTIEAVLQKWDQYKILYPGNDGDSVTKRVYYRTFSSFDDAVKTLLNNDMYKNIVFPAGYFNRIGKEFGLYAHHYYASTWFETETLFEKNVRQKLLKICRKNNQIMMISFACFSLSFLIALSLLLQIRSLKKQIKQSYKKEDL